MREVPLEQSFLMAVRWHLVPPYPMIPQNCKLLLIQLHLLHHRVVVLDLLSLLQLQLIRWQGLIVLARLYVAEQVSRFRRLILLVMLYLLELIILGLIPVQPVVFPGPHHHHRVNLLFLEP